MTIGAMPICMACAHLHVNMIGQNSKQTCDAFPKGIPAAIFLGGFDHRQSFRGDKGVRFELSEAPGAALDLSLYEQGKETRIEVKSFKPEKPEPAFLAAPDHRPLSDEDITRMAKAMVAALPDSAFGPPAD